MFKEIKLYGKIIWRRIKIPACMLQMWILLSYKETALHGLWREYSFKKGKLKPREKFFLMDEWTTERSSTIGKKETLRPE